MHNSLIGDFKEGCTWNEYCHVGIQAFISESAAQWPSLKLEVISLSPFNLAVDRGGRNVSLFDDYVSSSVNFSSRMLTAVSLKF